MRIKKLAMAFCEKDEKINKAQAIERALALFNAMTFCPDASYEDEWFGLSDEWDLNVWEDATDGKIRLTLYPVKDGQTRTWAKHINVL